MSCALLTPEVIAVTLARLVAEEIVYDQALANLTMYCGDDSPGEGAVLSRVSGWCQPHVLYWTLGVAASFSVLNWLVSCAATYQAVRKEFPNPVRWAIWLFSLVAFMADTGLKIAGTLCKSFDNDTYAALTWTSLVLDQLNKAQGVIATAVKLWPSGTTFREGVHQTCSWFRKVGSKFRGRRSRRQQEKPAEVELGMMAARVIGAGSPLRTGTPDLSDTQMVPDIRIPTAAPMMPTAERRRQTRPSSHSTGVEFPIAARDAVTGEVSPQAGSVLRARGGGSRDEGE